jgi:hypothetical protein
MTGKGTTFCRRLGTTVRVVGVGLLLFLALTALYAVQTGASVFRYAQF